MRIGILGLYNSGSSVLSQIVELLGVEIGRPLWYDAYESRSLRAQLCDWWKEPDLVETVAAEHRIPFLRWWAEYHEEKNPNVCGKHPLLCLSGFDLDEAWGPDYKAIWAARPLQDSIARLERRNWFAEPKRMQRTLHEACERYFVQKAHLAVDHRDLLADPLSQVERIVAYLELDVPTERMQRAAAVVRTNRR